MKPLITFLYVVYYLNIITAAALTFKQHFTDAPGGGLANMSIR